MDLKGPDRGEISLFLSPLQTRRAPVYVLNLCRQLDRAIKDLCGTGQSLTFLIEYTKILSYFECYL